MRVNMIPMISLLLALALLLGSVTCDTVNKTSVHSDIIATSLSSITFG